MRFLPPLVERDLRIAARKHEFRKYRFRLTCIGAGFTALILFLNLHFPRIDGKYLHLMLFAATSIGSTFLLLHSVSTTISEERESQNLGLMFLAGLTPAEVIAGKLAGTILVHAQLLLCCVPFLAIPIFLGGTSMATYLASLVSLGVLFLFILSVGTLASVIAKDSMVASRLSLGLCLFFMLLMPVIYEGYRWFSTNAASAEFLLLFSPAYGPVALVTSFGSMKDLYFNYLWTTALSVLIFGIAFKVLSQSWKDTDTFGPLKNRYREWCHGRKSERLESAKFWLDRNPMGWLFEHERHPVAIAWAILWGFSALWLICWILWPTGWVSVPNFLFSALFLIVAVAQCMSTATGRRIAEDRRTGAMEILVTTPLTPREIVDGQLEGTLRQFAPVWKALLVLQVSMMFAGVFIREWTPSAFIVYVLSWSIVLAAPWASLRCRPKAGIIWIAMNYGRVINPIQGATMWLVVFQLGLQTFRLVRRGPSQYQFPSGHIVEYCIVFGVIFIAALGYGINYRDQYRQRLLKHFREIAQEVPPDSSKGQVPKFVAKFEKWH